MRIFETLWFPVVLVACGSSQHQPREEPPSDADEDGIVDSDDGCPSAPEDFDGDADEDGCPDCDLDIEWAACVFEEGAGSCAGASVEDRDGDGISNEIDLCPEIPEDDDSFEDEDGCPDADNDADCSVDEHDRCPNEAGPVSNGGCPDPGVINQ